MALKATAIDIQAIQHIATTQAGTAALDCLP